MSPQEKGGQEWAGRHPSSIREVNDPQRYAGKESHSNVDFNLTGDRSPFGSPPELTSILEDIFSSGELIKALEIYGYVSNGPTIENIREHYRISSRPEIITTTDGTDSMIDLFFKLAPNEKGDKPTRVLGVGMHFPVAVESIKNAGPHISYVPTRAPITASIEACYERVKNYINKAGKKYRFIAYDNFPTTPKGEVVDPDVRTDFYLFCRDRNITVLTDEAYAGYLTNDESAIKMVDDLDQNTGEPVFNNLAVLRSLSKGDAGTPGARLGALIASPEVGREFRKLKMPYSNAIDQMIFNRISDTKIITPHLERIRRLTPQIKPVMVDLFRANGFVVEATDNRTPIFLVDGLSSAVYANLKKLGVDVTPAGAFGETIYDVDYGHDTSNRFFRVTIPGSLEKMHQILENFNKAFDSFDPRLRGSGFRKTI